MAPRRISRLPIVPRLPYEALRPLLQSGDILLCAGSSPMSRMIQAATDSPYSHVAFLLRLEALNRVMVLESVESIGVRACGLRAYASDYNGTGMPYPGRLFLARHRGVEVHEPQALQLFAQTAVDYLGYPYDTREILSITARIVAQKLGMAAAPLRQNKTFICSEYCCICFAALGITIPYNPANFIAPADFATCPEVQVQWELDTQEGVP